ncbi:hypothetical protein JCM8208_004247 [Rhodotorula glutinis]
MDPQPSTSSSTSSPLLKLPLELLDAIFSQVYEPYSVRYSPLCKRLLPVQQRQFWRRREFNTYEDLAAFSRRAPFIPGLETNVVELELNMMNAPRWENERLEAEHEARLDEGFSEDDEPDPVDPDFELCPLALFVEVFECLAAVRHVVLRGVDDVWVSALVGDEAEICAVPPWLERLESVHVEFSFDSRFLEPDDMQAWLGALARAPGLRALRLVDEDIPTWEPMSPPTPIPTLPNLQSLVIDGGSLYSWTGAPLSRVAPNLAHLELLGSHPPHQVVAVLREAPVHLRELVVAPDPGLTAVAVPRLDHVLPQLAHLRHLRLAGQTFDPARIVASLGALPCLESLAFGLDAPVTDIILDAILEGPHRLSRLRHLTLEHFRAYPGLSLKLLDDKVPHDLEALGFDLPPSWAWKRPECPPGGSEAGLREAVRSGSAHGVVVDGMSLGLFDWDDWYRVERRNVILAWASRAEGRWDVARARRRHGGRGGPQMNKQILIGASASSSLGPPPLLQLPDELLDNIMRHAHEGKDAPSSQPVCRRLRPHQERQLCRRVRLVSDSALLSFSEFIQRKPSFAHVVLGLDLHLPHKWAWEAATVAPAFLGGLINKLQQLQELRVVAVGEVIDSIVQAEATSLLKLRRLELVPSYNPSVTGTTGKNWLERLGRLPALEHVTYDVVTYDAVTYDVEGHGHPFLVIFDRRAALVGLTSLHLSVPDFSDWPVSDLSTIMPNLVELELSGLESEASVDEVLLAVPVGIRKLVLCPDAEETWYNHEFDTPSLLVRLVHLERLELGGFEFDDDLLPALTSLPRLRDLVFRLGACATDELIRDLATVHRPPSLSRVVFDHVTSTIGPSYLDNGFEWDEDARSTDGHALPGWVGPVWPDGCTEAGQCRAMFALEGTGIVVEGTAEDATGYLSCWAAEAMYGTMLMCMEDEDMSEMEKFYGEAFTADWLCDLDYPLWLECYGGTEHDDRTSSECDADEDRWY